MNYNNDYPSGSYYNNNDEQLWDEENGYYE